MQTSKEDGQISLFGQDMECGKMSQEHFPAQTEKTSKSSSNRSSKLKNHTFMLLDLRPGAGNILGPCWEYDPVWLGSLGTLNTSECPSAVVESSLSQILQDTVPSKYYLSPTACMGILRRAEERGKDLPTALAAALRLQAGIQRPEDNNLHGEIDEGDGYDGDLRGDASAALGTNCGMSTERNGALDPTPFANNQQDEAKLICGKDDTLSLLPPESLHVSGLITKGNGDCFITEEKHTTLSTGGGQAGQGYPCIFAAGFSAGAGATAGSIGYDEEIAPTLKGSASGNCMPTVFCLNDQGGRVMDVTKEMTGTLRAQTHGHEPLVFDAHGQDTRYRGPVECSPTLSASLLNHPLVVDSPQEPALYENHGIDARYTGPHAVSPTLSARAGTGGNNLPLVAAPEETYCITGNAIDRQPHNGGNGIGYQPNLSYTLTATDHHAVFRRQRVDLFQSDTVAGTQSARQYKDATDLIYQQFPEKMGMVYLIRRLTPMECERLQGYPDGWTNMPNVSDSNRYKALGNSVAIPCVQYLIQRIAMCLMLGFQGYF